MQETGSDEANRAELARFLRRRRAQIDPHTFDLPLSPRRRATGLLREEVAALAGVSTTWYTFLEQAREIRPSVQTLDRVAAVLALDDAERGYVHRLAFGLSQPGRTDVAAEETLANTIVAGLAAAPHPIYAATVAGLMLAWNTAAADWYTDWSVLPRERRNMYWWMWTDRAARDVFPDWEFEATDVIGRMRSAYAVPEFQSEMEPVIRSLSRASGGFAGMWNDYAPTDHFSRARRMKHPAHGERAFLITALFTVTSRRFAVLVHSPLD